MLADAIAAAYTACAWILEHAGDPTTRQTLTRLTAALGAGPALSEPAHS